MKIDYDCVVIGAGPAGITASIYLKRANLKCLLIEKNVPGGQVAKSSTVANYPGFKEISGPDLALNFYNQVKDLKIEYKYGEVTEIIDKKKYKVIKLASSKEKIKTKSVIIATGRHPKTLESLKDKDNFGGVSYCALCDAALYKNEDVAIVGGGNSALEESLYLSDICKSVIIINRSEKLRGDIILINKIKKKKNIKVLFNSEIEKFNEEENKLESLDVNVAGKIKNLSVKACFIFIGYEPDTKFLNSLDILDEKGYVIVDEKYETKIKNIFAAGDIVRKDAYQIVTATSDGALAAVSCIKNLN